jgi:hypothetical protein
MVVAYVVLEVLSHRSKEIQFVRMLQLLTSYLRKKNLSLDVQLMYWRKCRRRGTEKLLKQRMDGQWL